MTSTLASAPNQHGGYGTPIYFTSTTMDGYNLEVEFNASHETDLPDAQLHSITVSR